MLRRGGRVAAAFSEEAVMNKIESCGIEVSARELVVAWERKKGGLRRFANTSAGHRALLGSDGALRAWT